MLPIKSMNAIYRPIFAIFTESIMEFDNFVFGGFLLVFGSKQKPNQKKMSRKKVKNKQTNSCSNRKMGGLLLAFTIHLSSILLVGNLRSECVLLMNKFMWKLLCDACLHVPGTIHVSMSHMRQLVVLYNSIFIAFSFCSFLFQGFFLKCVCEWVSVSAPSNCQSVNCQLLMIEKEREKLYSNSMNFRVFIQNQYLARHTPYVIRTIFCGIFVRAHRNKRCLQMIHENYVNWMAESHTLIMCICPSPILKEALRYMVCACV